MIGTCVLCHKKVDLDTHIATCSTITPNHPNNNKMNDTITPAPTQSYTNTEDNNTLLTTTIGYDHKELTFTIKHFTEKDQTWLKNIIPQLLQKAYNHGFNEAKHMIRTKLHEALGTKQ